MKVVGYGRISDEDDEPTSLANQEQLAKDEAKASGMEFAGWYRDRNVSGGIDPFERDGFSDLVAQLEEDPDIDVVLVKNGKRLWRDGKTEDVIKELQRRELQVEVLEIQPSDLTEMRQEIDSRATSELIGDIETFLKRRQIEEAREEAIRLISNKREKDEPFHRPPRGITTNKQREEADYGTDWVPVEEYRDDEGNRVRHKEFDTCIEMLNEMATTDKSPYQAGKEHDIPNPDRKMKNLWKRRDFYRDMVRVFRPNTEIKF